VQLSKQKKPISFLKRSWPKPYLVSSAAQGKDNVITRRVEPVLDTQFANGSMPA
jgi:hypothetical protein